MDLLNPVAIPGNPRNSYNTQLLPDQEKAYTAWKNWNLHPADLIYGPTEDYDMRGYFANPGEGTQMNAMDGMTHYPDTYKKPWHQTFSDQSQYLKYAPMMGGHPFETGNSDPKKSWYFMPGAQQALQRGVMGHYY